MPYRWPSDTDFALLELDVIDRNCPVCGRMMYICDHRHRHFITLKALSIWSPSSITVPTRLSGAFQDQEPRDRTDHRFARLGHRLGRLLLDRASAIFASRVDSPDPCGFARRLCHRARGDRDRQLHPPLPGDARGTSARPRGPAAAYTTVDSLILSIDGLQPEKGHETLYVVRELTGKRVWFAEALLSATADEVRRLIAQAKQWARTWARRSPSGSRTSRMPS